MLPEVESLPRSDSVIRIPLSGSVPISPRVRRLVDTAPMRRLASISQLGLVSLVYPGATHSRLEHSLGVYGNALQFLARLEGDQQGKQSLDSRSCEAFIVASLVHDVGHWPFCHPIEDMRLDGLGEHESRVRHWLSSSEIDQCISEDWECSIDDIVQLLEPESARNVTPVASLLASCLSGPIDVDKLDYLGRDSLHCGVPYGNNFDRERLIGSLCVEPETNQLAVGEKGRTAAEMMVFARYIMFSEVYWHHAVRSATAMLQRAIFLLQHRMDLDGTLSLNDSDWIAMLRRTAEGSVAEHLVEGLFGTRRELYKRVAEFNVLDDRAEIHQRLARRPYWWLVACAEHFAKSLSNRAKVAVHAADVLIDAPPTKLEVDINMNVVMRDGSINPLGDVSPVVSALANQQFDNQVKKVRLFLRGDLRRSLMTVIKESEWADLLMESIQETEDAIA